MTITEQHEAVDITCQHCESTVTRHRLPGSPKPKYCSKRCGKRDKNRRWANRRWPVRNRLCEAPGAALYRDSPKGLREAQKAAEAYGLVVWRGCPCLGIHLDKKIECSG